MYIILDINKNNEKVLICVKQLILSSMKYIESFDKQFKIYWCFIRVDVGFMGFVLKDMIDLRWV